MIKMTKLERIRKRMKRYPVFNDGVAMHWIMCVNTLPPKKQDVYICTYYDILGDLTVWNLEWTRGEDGKWFFTDNGTDITDRVIAWMPYPRRCQVHRLSDKGVVKRIVLPKEVESMIETVE